MCHCTLYEVAKQLAVWQQVTRVTSPGELKPSFFRIFGRQRGQILLKTQWREGWHWPPAGIRQISGIQKVETLIFWFLGPNCIILHKFCRKSSFMRQVGLIIGSSRSGTSFSSCLASSLYFSILVTKTCLFLRYNFFYVYRLSLIHI